MTNTLTWDIKPIQLPKLNANLLSVISLIVLCMMFFVTINTIAEACDDLKAKVKTAEIALDLATGAVLLAMLGVQAAQATGIQWVIDAAIANLDFWVSVGEAALKYYNECVKELNDCLNAPKADSGGCDSGSCA